MTAPHPHTIHICAMARDQRSYEVALGNWLIKTGYKVLATSQSERSTRLQAARDCDACIVLLGDTFGSQRLHSHFSEVEMEVSAAASDRRTKVFVFLQEGAEGTDSPEQSEFIDRLSQFTSGLFRKMISSPEMLIEEVKRALATWQSLQAEEQPEMRVLPGSWMISSTGDMVQERETVRALLLEWNLSIIDYLHEAAQAVPPVDRVISWARECRVLVLLLGSKYGYISPADGLGATELEFVTALRAGRPILVFVRSDACITTNLDQKQFLARVRAFVPEQWVFSFTDTQELAQAFNRAGLQLRQGYTPAALPDGSSTTDKRRWYHQQVKRWLGKLPHLTHAGGMPLESVYISLQAFSQTKIPSEKEDDKRAFSDPTKEDTRTPLYLNVDSALRTHSRLLLLGDPGSGKSATLCYYAISVKEDMTPVLIRLGSYALARRNGTVLSLMDAIVREERRLVLALNETVSMWRSDMENGKGLILLDAFDEVPQDLQKTVAEDIQRIVDDLRATTTKIVLTSRITGFDAQRWPDFFPAQVQHLERPQQRQLVEKWMLAAHAPEDQNTPYTQEMRDAAAAQAECLLIMLEQNVRLQELARTPLLLTFLTALTYVSETKAQVFPATKAEIYHRILRLLLARWRSVSERQTARELEKRLDMKMDVLLELARVGVLESEKRKQIFTVAEFKQVYMTVRQNVSLSEASRTDALDLLSELSGQNGDGILSRLAEDQYTFAHPTIQEYLAATLIATEYPSQEREQLILKRRLSAQWEDVTQFLVSELDRLQRPAEANALVWTLIRGDQMPIARFGWEDPLHLALLRAARCQGGRSRTYAEQGPGPYLSTVLVRLASAEEDERSPLAMQALAALGVGASPVLEELSRFIAIIAQNGMSANRGRMINEMVAVLKQLGPVANPLLHHLYQDISSSDEHIQWVASRMLNLMGPSAIPGTREAIAQLCDLLENADYKVSMNVVDVLNYLDEAARPAVQVACQMLCSLDAERSARGTLILNKMYPVAIPELCTLINNPEARIRKKAANALFLMLSEYTFFSDPDGTNQEKSLSLEKSLQLVNHLLPGLADQDEGIRHDIGESISIVLSSLGESAKPLIENLVKYSQTSRAGQREILEILSYLNMETLPSEQVRLLLRSPDLEVRKQGLRIIEHSHLADKPVLAEIRAMLHRSPTPLLLANLQTLMHLELNASEWYDDIYTLLSDKDREVRIAAIELLHHLDPQNMALIEKELRILLQSNIPDICKRAFRVLADMDAVSLSEAFLEDLSLFLGTPHDASLRSSAVVALSKVQPDSASLIAKIRPLLHDSAKDVRKCVIKVISEVRPVILSTLVDLCEALRDPSKEVRELAFDILRPRSKEASSSLADDAAQLEVHQVLCTEGNSNTQIVGHLRNALHDSDADIRAKAVIIAGCLKTTANPLLKDLRRLVHDPDKGVRRAIAQTLGNLGPDVSWSINALCSLLPDFEFEEGLWMRLFFKMAGQRGFPNDGAVEALGRVGQLSPSVLKQLSRFLGHSEEAISLFTRELTSIEDAEAPSVAARITRATP